MGGAAHRMEGPQAEAEKPPMKTATQASATAPFSVRGSFTSHIMGGVLVITMIPAPPQAPQTGAVLGRRVSV